MVEQPTLRVYARFRVRCWLTLRVDHKKILARAVEMSGSGARIESVVPIAVGSLVRIRSRVSLLAGRAYVRHCGRQGLVYRIGLEFGQPLADRF